MDKHPIFPNIEVIQQVLKQTQSLTEKFDDSNSNTKKLKDYINKLETEFSNYNK